MPRAKTFKLSEPVDVQLTTDSNEPWIEAIYVGRVDTMPGWHEVRVLGCFRHIDRFGNKVSEGDPNAVVSTDRHIVPARRIRERPKLKWALEEELRELERTNPEVREAAKELDRVSREIVERTND